MVALTNNTASLHSHAHTVGYTDVILKL